MSMLTKFVAAAAFAGTGVLGAAAPVGAQPVTQEGLVNVNLTDVTVQVPIALAANVCDVNVAVLVDELSDAAAPCTASADPTAMVTTQDGGPVPVQQRGLVNVNITDLVVQVPIGIAANVCDVNVGVLVRELRDAAADCDATATPDAITVIS